MSRASGFILRQVDLARRFCMCTAGGSTREAPGHIATLSGTSPRGRARGHLCRTIDLLPSIRFLQPLMMCWRLTAGWTTAGYAGLLSPETLPEEISALVLASCVAARAVSAKATLVGAAALSPVTDLTLSGAHVRDTCGRRSVLYEAASGRTGAFLSRERRRERSTGFAAPGTFVRVASHPHSRRRRRSAAR